MADKKAAGGGRAVISLAEMKRDREVYLALRHVATFEERVLLMSKVGDYPGYRRMLFKFAKRHGIVVPEVVEIEIVEPED